MDSKDYCTMFEVKDGVVGGLWEDLGVQHIDAEQLRSLDANEEIGRGTFGVVRRVVYEGQDAVVKELLDPDDLEELYLEARVMVRLDGAGGAPRVLAVCCDPPALVQEFVGAGYKRYLQACTVDGYLASLGNLCRRIKEIHKVGFVHCDLKSN